MVEKIKADVDRLLLVLKMKTKLPIYFVKTEVLFNLETKSPSSFSPSMSFFIFYTISQI